MKLGASAAATLPLLATAAKAATTHNVTIKSLNKGGAATLTFASAGSFDYFCKFHPNMKGKITIA